MIIYFFDEYSTVNVDATDHQPPCERDIIFYLYAAETVIYALFSGFLLILVCLTVCGEQHLVFALCCLPWAVLFEPGVDIAHSNEIGKGCFGCVIVQGQSSNPDSLCSHACCGGFELHLDQGSCSNCKLLIKYAICQV